jgi:hypothetical protein
MTGPSVEHDENTAKWRADFSCKEFHDYAMHGKLGGNAAVRTILLRRSIRSTGGKKENGFASGGEAVGG